MLFLRRWFVGAILASMSWGSLVQGAESLQLRNLAIHTQNESSLRHLLQLIDEAIPGSTVDMGLFILDDDYSASLLFKRMQERAAWDHVKFRIAVDYIMSEAETDLLQFLASIPNFEVRRILPPTKAFRKHLTDELQMQNSEIFIKGLCLQNKGMILEGLKSSPLIESVLNELLATLGKSSGPIDETQIEANHLLQILMSPRAREIIPQLVKFERHFLNFTRRFHHKIQLVRTKEGLKILHGGRNNSDEYRMTTGYPLGDEILANRAYPFYDLEISGTAATAQTEMELSATFERIWNAGSAYAEKVRPPSTEAEQERLREFGLSLFKRGMTLEARLDEIRAFEKSGARSLVPQSEVVTFDYLENLNRGHKAISDRFVDELNQAQKRFIAISAYLYLDGPELQAVADAVNRGVEVIFYTNSPLTTDMGMVNIGAYQAFPQWMSLIAPDKQHLLKIYELDTEGKKGSLHAKLILRDQEILGIGSAHFDSRSRNLDMNNFSFLKLTDVDYGYGIQVVDSVVQPRKWNLLTAARANEMLSRFRIEKPNLVRMFGCRWFILQL